MLKYVEIDSSRQFKVNYFKITQSHLDLKIRVSFANSSTPYTT